MSYRQVLNHASLDIQTKQRLEDEYDKVNADLVELRAQFIALLAKLDADAGITDTDYESSLTPAAITFVS